MTTSDPNAANPPLDYAQPPRRLRRAKILRVLKRIVLLSLPLWIYVGLYLGFARRDVAFGGLLRFAYPGAERWYALSDRAASVIGRDGDDGAPPPASLNVRRFEDSLWRAGPRAYTPLWRGFYPLERFEILLRGGTVVPIRYPGAPIDAATAANSMNPAATTQPTPSAASATTTTAEPPKLPYLGPVYHEWFVRDGRLYRFVGAEYGGRAAFFVPVTRADVYLFEWDIATPFPTPDAPPRPAARARRVDFQPHTRWDDHWLVDADHYLTYDKHRRTASLLQFVDQQHPAKVVATLQGVGPVRCDTYSPINVNRSARFFAAEKDGLTIFDTKTLAAARRVKETPALQRFFAARRDEADNRNSRCYLTNDAKQLVRVVKTETRVPGAAATEWVDHLFAAIYDLDADTVRDVPLDLGLGTHVKDLERVDGAFQFCLQYNKSGKMWGKWPQYLADESLHPLCEVTPVSSSGGLESVTWDPAAARLVDLPGHTANPQPLELEAEIMIQDARSGQRARGKIRYADPNGLPAHLFTPGVIPLDPFAEPAK